jgi:hypothetical protein
VYSIIHERSIKELLSEHLPTLAVSLIIAELFYKFHSFLLEAIAFLATWYVLGALFNAVERTFHRD